MQSLCFALLSMGCAAANDFVFKLYARRRQAQGAYLAIIGLIWAVTFLFIRPFSAWNAATLQWGIISGVFSIAANLLLVRALREGDVGICAAIYRLNLVPAAVLAIILFNENASFIRLAAIASGAAAVILFSGPGRAAYPLWHHAALRYVVAASFLRAGMGLSYKAGLLNGAAADGILVLNGLAWAAGGGLFWIVGENFNWRLSRVTLKFGFISGMLVCGIVGFLMLALKQGDASLVLPITQMSFALTAVFGVVVLNEPLTLNKFACLSLAVLSVILLGIK
jgi:uncharacterized membrane protein